MVETDVFPSFRHSINDVPADHWTVEEVFQWTLLKSQSATDEKFKNMEKKLRQQMEDGIQAILDLQNRTETGSSSENQNPNTASIEDSKSTENSTSNRDIPQATSDGASAGSVDLTVDIKEGEHKGKTFKLNVTEMLPCLVGRSRGRKFQQQGISLFKDLEVSTTHGKFALVNGKPCFVDTGSTNGTKVVLDENIEKELDPDEPFELSTGAILKCGASYMEVTVH